MYRLQPVRNPIKEAQKRYVVLGMPGSGKTYYCFQNFFFAVPKGWGKYSRASALRERNIFFDTNSSHVETDTYEMIRANTTLFKKDVIIVTDTRDFIRAFDAGLHHIIVAPRVDEDTESFRERVYDITDMMYSVQKMTPYKYLEPIYLYYDEVASLTPKMTPSIITETYTRGRRFKLCPVSISQRPAMVNKSIIDNSDYDVIFMLKQEHFAALRRAGNLDVSDPIIAELASTKYLYYTYDGVTWKKKEGK